MAQYPGTLESANPNEFSIVFAKQVGGHKTVATLSELYAISDAILSASRDNTNDDAIGQRWYVVSEDMSFKLTSWEHRHDSKGWTEDADKYVTELPDSYQSNQVVGGLDKISVSDIKNKTYNEIFEDMLFPDKDATIVNPSVTYADPAYTTKYEVGTGASTINTTLKTSMVNAFTAFSKGSWVGKGSGVMSDSTYASIKANDTDSGNEGYNFTSELGSTIWFGSNNIVTLKIRWKKAANEVLTYKGKHNPVQPINGEVSKFSTITGSVYIGHNATKYVTSAGADGSVCSKVTDLLANNTSLTREGLNTSFNFYAEFDEASTQLPNGYASVWIPTSIAYSGGSSKTLTVSLVAKAYNPVSSAADRFDQPSTFNKTSDTTTRVVNGTIITYTRYTRSASVKSDIKLHLTISLS